MNRKRMIGIIILLTLALSATAFAVTLSGDLELDTALSELNATAHLDFDSFQTDLSLSYNLKESQVEYFTTQIKMEPADIVMACELSVIAKMPVDKVVEVYKVNKAKGWGAIAKELGIKPGSAEFKALKGKVSGYTVKMKQKGKGKEKGKK